MKKVEITTGQMTAGSEVIIDGVDVSKEIVGLQLTMEKNSANQIVVHVAPAIETVFDGMAEITVVKPGLSAEMLDTISPSMLLEKATAEDDWHDTTDLMEKALQALKEMILNAD